jgi:hypothetical protein
MAQLPLTGGFGSAFSTGGLLGKCSVHSCSILPKIIMERFNLSNQGTTDIKRMRDLISSFYPLDNNNANKTSLGYQHLLEITTEKINLLIAGKLHTLCSQLINSLHQNLKNLKISPDLEKQFPSYAFTIELVTNDNELITVISSIKLTISMLGDYYTMFHDEMIYTKVFRLPEQVLARL